MIRELFFEEKLMDASIVSKLISMLQEEHPSSFGELCLLADREDPSLLPFLATQDGMLFSDRLIKELPGKETSSRETEAEPLKFYASCRKESFSTACSLFHLNQEEGKECERKGKVEAIRLFIRFGKTSDPDMVRVAKLAHECNVSNHEMSEYITYGAKDFYDLERLVRKECAGVPDLDPVSVLADRIGMSPSALA